MADRLPFDMACTTGPGGPVCALSSAASTVTEDCNVMYDWNAVDMLSSFLMLMVSL